MSLVLGALILFGLPLGVGVLALLGVLLGIRLVFKGIEDIVRSSAGAKLEHIGERRAA